MRDVLDNIESKFDAKPSGYWLRIVWHCKLRPFHRKAHHCSMRDSYVMYSWEHSSSDTIRSWRVLVYPWSKISRISRHDVQKHSRLVSVPINCHLTKITYRMHMKEPQLWNRHKPTQRLMISLLNFVELAACFFNSRNRHVLVNIACGKLTTKTQ